MPEIPNRDELEANFARKFGRVARRHLFEFRELLGYPPDLDNVPQEFWDRMEREAEHSVYPFLLLLFGSAALMYQWRGSDADLAAYGFASDRSESFATQWINGIRKRIEDFQKRLDDAGLTSGRHGGPGGLFEGFAGHEPIVHTDPLTGDELQDDKVEDLDWLERLRKTIDDSFGPIRIQQNIEDLTTEARHAGQEAAVEATVGLSPDDKWVNTGSHICPTCIALDQKPRRYWARFFPDGPPSPHSRCKCEIEYRHAMAVKSWFATKSFNADQPRDEHGRWSAMGIDATPATHVAHQDHVELSVMQTPGYAEFQRIATEYRRNRNKEIRTELIRNLKQSYVDQAEQFAIDHNLDAKQAAKSKRFFRIFASTLIEPIKRKEAEHSTWAYQYAFSMADGSVCPKQNLLEKLEKHLLGTEQHPYHRDLANTGLSYMTPEEREAWFDATGAAHKRQVDRLATIGLDEYRHPLA